METPLSYLHPFAGILFLRDRNRFAQIHGLRSPLSQSSPFHPIDWASLLFGQTRLFERRKTSSFSCPGFIFISVPIPISISIFQKSSDGMNRVRRIRTIKWRVRVRVRGKDLTRACTCRTAEGTLFPYTQAFRATACRWRSPLSTAAIFSGF